MNAWFPCQRTSLFRHCSVRRLKMTVDDGRRRTVERQVSGLIARRPLERRCTAENMQIFEGTNQIQRLVIARHLAKAAAK